MPEVSTLKGHKKKLTKEELKKKENIGLPVK